MNIMLFINEINIRKTISTAMVIIETLAALLMGGGACKTSQKADGEIKALERQQEGSGTYTENLEIVLNQLFTGNTVPAPTDNKTVTGKTYMAEEPGSPPVNPDKPIKLTPGSDKSENGIKNGGTGNEGSEIEKTPPAQEEMKIRYPAIWGNKSRAEVSLTFDDGNDRKSIERVLDALRTAGLKCTFFITGQALENNADLFRQAAAEGHQICNHTYSHRFLSNAGDDDIRNEIGGWESTAVEILGEDYVKKMKKQFPYFRLPGGSGGNSERIMKIIAEKGYIPVGWAVETYYAVLRHYKLGSGQVEPIADKVVSHVIDSSGNGAIILLHFTVYDTLRLEDIIKGINEKGLDIKNVSEMMKSE